MTFLRHSRYSLPKSQVTPEAAFWNRREFLRGLALAAAAAALPACNSKEDIATEPTRTDLPPRPSDTLYPPTRNEKYKARDRQLTPPTVAGHYNNFYEFNTDQSAGHPLASHLSIDP